MSTENQGAVASTGDGKADGIAAVIVISVFVATIVYWISNQSF